MNATIISRSNELSDEALDGISGGALVSAQSAIAATPNRTFSASVSSPLSVSTGQVATQSVTAIRFI